MGVPIIFTSRVKENTLWVAGIEKKAFYLFIECNLKAIFYCDIENLFSKLLSFQAGRKR